MNVYAYGMILERNQRGDIAMRTHAGCVSAPDENTAIGAIFKDARSKSTDWSVRDIVLYRVGGDAVYEAMQAEQAGDAQ